MPQPRAKRNAFTKALAQTFASADEAVTVADIGGYIIEANEAVEQVYRWPREKLMGQHPLKFCPDTPVWKKLSSEIWKTMEVGDAWTGAVINKDVEENQFPILLRVRKVVYNRVPYIISWARPFPSGTPFNLSVQEAEIFKLLGQSEGGAKMIAEKLTNRDKRKGSKNKGKKGIRESTVNVHLPRIWKKAGKDPKKYSIHKLRRLAILCLEAGWDTTLKINQEMLGK